MSTDDFTDDDVLLSAWLDGELPAEQADALTARLAREPALAARLETLRSADEIFSTAYSPVADEPVPEHIVALLTGPAGAAQSNDNRESAGANVVPFPRPFVAQLFTMPSAMAAGIALMFGFLLAYVMAPQLRDQGDAGLAQLSAFIGPDDPLYGILERSPGGAATEVAPGRRALARMSFRSLDGDYCRQLDVGDARGTTYALACRREEGWQVALAGFHDGPLIVDDEAVYRPASGPAATLFDLAVDELIDGDVLSAEEEQVLIEQRWQVSDR